MIEAATTLELAVRSVRTLRTSSARLGQRAIVYSQNGDPSTVLSAVTFPDLSPPAPGTVNVRFLLSPINPADLNVIEGVYPARPSPSPHLSSSYHVGGNEGVAEVLAVGDDVPARMLRKKDWVVMTTPQMGTWTSSRNVRVEDVLKVDASVLNAVQAATLTVNPPTALNMLHDFVRLKAGDWVVQNGANSAVGQAVIQIAASEGIKTINFIRDRENVDALKSHLKALGATHVATYDELSDRAFKSTTFSSWTQGEGVKLGLNCVGGKTTTLMARLLGDNAHLVSYGAMSKEPLSLPTSLFIFKNLTCHGFWQSRWYSEKSMDERIRMMDTLTGLVREKKLGDPEHEILVIQRHESDSDAGDKIRAAMSLLGSGRHGKKVLLKIEETDKVY